MSKGKILTSLFVDRRGVHLELESGAIVFRENGERIGTVPIAPLTRVFLRGDVHLSGCLLGKAGRTHYYAAYEDYSEVLRAGIQAQVDETARRVGHVIEAQAFDSDGTLAE